jgi:hypothetical protein
LRSRRTRRPTSLRLCLSGRRHSPRRRARSSRCRWRCHRRAHSLTLLRRHNTAHTGIHRCRSSRRWRRRRDVLSLLRRWGLLPLPHRTRRHHCRRDRRRWWWWWTCQWCRRGRTRRRRSGPRHGSLADDLAGSRHGDKALGFVLVALALLGLGQDGGRGNQNSEYRGESHGGLRIFPWEYTEIEKDSEQGNESGLDGEGKDATGGADVLGMDINTSRWAAAKLAMMGKIAVDASATSRLPH